MWNIMAITRYAITLSALSVFIAANNAIVIDETEPNQLCTKPNTEYKVCESSTQPTCETPNPQAITADCGTGCYCKGGYLLNNNGDCVLPSECPPQMECPANKTYSTCAQTCRKTCETQYLNLMHMCMCRPGCDCQDGYVADGKGNCILPKDCDPAVVRCPPNKVYSACHSGEINCDGTQIMYYVCPSGCFCKPGYYLNDKGDCVEPDKCPKPQIVEPTCPKNETYVDCSLCERSCGTYYLNIMFKCACLPGCSCKDGYIRNSEDKCIKIEDCTREETACQDNQHFSYSEKRMTCKNPFGHGQKTSGCFCDDGLVYDESQRICIDPRECEESVENRECAANDEHSQFKSCQPGVIETCSGDVYNTGPCEAGCYCKFGYMLNAHGKCVSNCNDDCPPNSHFTENANECRNTCRLMLRDDITCPSDEPGCQCDDGYVWNDERQCVKKEDCPAEDIECPPRMKFHKCNRDVIRTCQDKRPAKVRDIELVECRWGCFCEPPYKYDSTTNSCIHPDECPQH